MKSFNILFRKGILDGSKEIEVMLCPLRSDDEALEIYTKWMNNEHVIKFLGRSSMPVTIEDEREWAEQQHKCKDMYSFNIIAKSYDNCVENLIGTCDIFVTKLLNLGTIGICIGDLNYTGLHYGRTVMRMLMDFGFKELNLKTLNLTTSVDNDKAVKCYEAVGFKIQGRTRNTFYYEGSYHDSYYMDITREEWEELHNAE